MQLAWGGLHADRCTSDLRKHGGKGGRMHTQVMEMEMATRSDLDSGWLRMWDTVDGSVDGLSTMSF